MYAYLTETLEFLTISTVETIAKPEMHYHTVDFNVWLIVMWVVLIKYTICFVNIQNMSMLSSLYTKNYVFCHQEGDFKYNWSQKKEDLTVCCFFATKK